MERQSYLLRSNHKFFILDLNSVTHISVKDYLPTVHCLEGNSHSCCSSLKRMEEHLPGDFIRINRNWLANVNLIQSFLLKEREIMLQNDLRLQVSKSKWTSIKKELIQRTSPKKAIQNTS